MPVKQPDTLISIIENDLGLSEENKVAELLTFLFAGHDTTALSLASALLNLSLYTNEQEKLRNCLNQTYPADWNKLDAVQNVFKESYRMIPAAAMGGRYRCAEYRRI
jgi:cytochrome P450